MEILVDPIIVPSGVGLGAERGMVYPICRCGSPMKQVKNSDLVFCSSFICEEPTISNSEARKWRESIEVEILTQIWIAAWLMVDVEQVSIEWT